MDNFIKYLNTNFTEYSSRKVKRRDHCPSSLYGTSMNPIPEPEKGSIEKEYCRVVRHDGMHRV